MNGFNQRYSLRDLEMEDKSFYEAFYEKRIKNSVFSDLAKVTERLILYNIIMIIKRHVGSSDKVIIDVGCGRGKLASRLTKYGRVVGIDFCETAIDFCKKRYLNAEFKVSNIFDMEFIEYNKGKFDIVISSEVIEHVPDELQKPFIQNLKLLAKKGGHIILTTPNRDTIDLLKNDNTLTSKEFYKKFEGQPLANLLSMDELKDLSNGIGEIITHESISPFIPIRVLDLILKTLSLPTNYVLLQIIQKCFKFKGKNQVICAKVY